MTKKEELFAYIKSGKRVSQAELAKRFGAGGRTYTALDELYYTRKIKKIACECGNSIFYEVRK